MHVGMSLYAYVQAYVYTSFHTYFYTYFYLFLAALHARDFFSLEASF